MDCMRLRRNISHAYQHANTPSRRRTSPMLSYAVARCLAHCPPNTKAPTALISAVGACRRACRRAGLICFPFLLQSSYKRRPKCRATIQRLIQPLVNPNYNGNALCIATAAKMPCLSASAAFTRTNKRFVNTGAFCRRSYSSLICFVAVFTS